MLAVAAALVTTAGGAVLPARIAFLDRGDVWMLTADRARLERQTRTGGKVEDFRYSPGGEYLAYAPRIRPAEGRPITSIVIVTVATGARVKEIRPSEGWIDIDKWLGTTLLYHASAAMEVSGFFEIDARTGVERLVEPATSSHTFDRDITPDGSLVTYVDDIGVGPAFEERLHLLDTATRTDTVNVSKRSVMVPAISPARDAVAFLEVFGDGPLARDRVWIHRPRDRTTRMIGDEPVMSKSAGSGLVWSPDNRRILVNFGNKISVLSVDEDAAPRREHGTDACWSDSRTIVAAGPQGLAAIDVASGVRRLLLSRGARPQCLAR